VIAYVPASRYKGRGRPRTLPRDPQNDDIRRDQWDLTVKYGAVYDTEIDATYPADPEIIKRFKAGEIPHIGKAIGGSKGSKRKYEVGYSWGKYKVVGHEKRKGGGGSRYIIRCTCGRERIVKSSVIGLVKSCNECRYRR
jgi:hypothetical protein